MSEGECGGDGECEGKKGREKRDTHGVRNIITNMLKNQDKQDGRDSAKNSKERRQKGRETGKPSYNHPT